MSRLSSKRDIGPRRRCSRCNLRGPLGSAPPLARRARGLSCCWCSNDGRLFLHHQNQGPRWPSCRAAQVCRPLRYRLAADVYQHPHAKEHVTRGCCFCLLRTTHSFQEWGGFGKSPSLENTSAAVRLNVQVFRDDQPTALLAVGGCTSSRLKLFNTTGYSDPIAGCGSTTAPTARCLPARSKIG